MKIKNRLFLAVFPLALIPMAIVSFFSFTGQKDLAVGLEAMSVEFGELSKGSRKSYQDVLEKMESESVARYRFALETLEAGISGKVEHVLQSMLIAAQSKDVAHFVSGSASVRRFMMADATAYLGSYVAGLDLTEVSLLDVEGRQLLATRALPPGESLAAIEVGAELLARVDHSASPWFAKRRESSEVFVYEFARGEAGPSEAWSLGICMELRVANSKYQREAGELAGYLRFVLPMESLAGPLRDARFEEGGVFLELNDGERWPKPEPGDALEADERIRMFLPVIDGRSSLVAEISRTKIRAKAVAAAQLVDATAHQAERIREQNAVLGERNRRAGQFLLIALLVVASLWPMVLLGLSKRLCEPLAKLSSAAMLVAQGKFDVEFAYGNQGDEIHGLSQSLERMRLRLKDHIGELDTIVSRKTEELRVANAKLQVEIAERAAAEQKAKGASEAKSDFLATMSHEIRTPMNGVIGMAEDLLARELAPENRERVEMIKLSGESLMRILDDILDFSKIEAGKMEIKAESFDFRLACRSTHMLFAARARRKGLVFGFEVADEVPQFIIGDAVRIRQIISNFLSNAIKFTNTGAVKLSISLSHRGKEGMSIRVSDTGVGIPVEKQQDIFEAFAQLSSDTDEDAGGTGLGLAICRRIASLMGGAISLESEEDKGSVFELWIPYQVGSPVESSDAFLDKLDTIKGASILLVEDNRINQHVIKSILESAEHEVVVASNGLDALERVNERRFDLVFMDCRMPKMDGFEASRRIRALPQAHFNHDVPIVALTANAFAHDREKCFDAGMNNFLAKPVARKRLLQTVNFYGKERGGSSREALDFSATKLL